MAIIDVLDILIRSNAKEATAEQERLNESNKKLELSYTSLTGHAEEWGRHLVERIFEVTAAYGALFEAEKLIDGFFDQTEATAQLGDLAKQIGINVTTLDQWGQAVKRVGGDQNAFGESMEHLNGQLARMQANPEQSRIKRFLQELGISATDTHGKLKSAFDLLPELAKAFDGMSASQSSGIGRDLGLDEGTIRLLQSGSANVAQLIAHQKQLGNITEANTEKAEKFERAWDDISQTFRNIYVDIGSFLLPVLEQLFAGIETGVSFLSAHKDLLVGTLLGIAGAAIVAIGPMTILDALLGFLLAPMALLAGAILLVGVAFGFIYDDVKNFMEGNKSVIGELSKRWPLLGETVRLAVKSVTAIWTVMWSVLKNGTVAFLDFFNVAFLSAIEILRAAYDVFKGIVLAIFDAVIGRGDPWTDLVNGFKQAGKDIKSFLPTIEQDMTDFVNRTLAILRALYVPFQAIEKFLGLTDSPSTDRYHRADGSPSTDRYHRADGSLRAAQTQLAATNTPLVFHSRADFLHRNSGSPTNVTVGDIHITTQATDAKGTAAAVKSELQKHLNTAINKQADGIAY